MKSINVTLAAIENLICRLELPLLDPLSIPATVRHSARDFGIRRIDDLYDLSHIDSVEKARLLDLLDHAYVYGGL